MDEISGHVAALYKGDAMQVWAFQRFDNDVKINLRDFDAQHVKDLAFTVDGKAAILGASAGKLLVFNTLNWQLIKSLQIGPNCPGVAEVAVVPRPLDGGSNSAVAVLLSDSSTRFIDLQAQKVLNTCDCGETSLTRRILVSRNGRFLVNVKKDGSLVVTWLDKLLRDQVESKKKLKGSKVQGHRAEDHLHCVQEAIKEELRMERLIPILKEFGEYPEKHRVLIWATIMKLPGNRGAFASLSNEEGGCGDLLRKCALADKGKASLLRTAVACLARWAPFLGECGFLPGFAFPFVVVFQVEEYL